MVQAEWFAPFAQVGRQIRVELRFPFPRGRLATFGHRRPPETPVVPEQRLDNWQVAGQRKAELFLQSVHHGAVRG